MKWVGLALMILGFGGCVSALQLERTQAATSETAAAISVILPLAAGIVGLWLWLRSVRPPPS